VSPSSSPSGREDPYSYTCLLPFGKERAQRRGRRKEHPKARVETLAKAAGSFGEEDDGLKNGQKSLKRREGLKEKKAHIVDGLVAVANSLHDGRPRTLEVRSIAMHLKG
jgi:hypothetical protein